MLVGDTQRTEVYAHRGFTAPEPMPVDARDAMTLLVDRDYTDRLR